MREHAHSLARDRISSVNLDAEDELSLSSLNSGSNFPRALSLWSRRDCFLFFPPSLLLYPRGRRTDSQTRQADLPERPRRRTCAPALARISSRRLRDRWTVGRSIGRREELELLRLSLPPSLFLSLLLVCVQIRELERGQWR